jgi:hypothetical protein
MKQDETDIKMQYELDSIAEKIKGKVYTDYCKYEGDVGELIELYCPTCKNVIANTGIGIFILMGNIRNYIRTKASIEFVYKEN